MDPDRCTSLHLLRAGDQAVDEQTASDLDLDTLFLNLNGCATTFGDQWLYHRLRRQPDAADALRCAEELAAYQLDTERTQRLRRRLERLGRLHRSDLLEDCATLAYRPRWLRWAAFWVVAAPLAAVLLGLVGGHWWLGAVVAAANLVFYLVTNPRISRVALSLRYALQAVDVLKRISRESWASRTAPDLAPYRSLLRLRGLAFLFRGDFGPSAAQDVASLLLDYLKIFLGVELLAYSLVVDRLDEPTALLLFEDLGRLDALISTSRYLASRTWTAPQWDASGALKVRALRHPLVDAAAGQDAQLTGRTIVTGMNMAGKSTFLKSLAVNQLLAGSLGFALAEAFHSAPYRVITSLNARDDVVSGRSRYFREVERLVEIRQLMAQGPTLAVIDEILSGTNTDDRVYASIGYLRHLPAERCVVVAATHDTAVAEALRGDYGGLYFDGEVREGNLVFDYLPHEGVVSRRNALDLLRLLGLEIGESARGER